MVISDMRSFRDGPKGQTRNLEVAERARQTTDSGFARSTRAPEMTRANSRRCRWLAQFAIVDIADRDRPPGQGAAETTGELQRHAGVKRGADRLEIAVADIRRHASRGECHARGPDHVARSLEAKANSHLHALLRSI